VRVPDEVTADRRLLAILGDQLGPDEPGWALAWKGVQCFDSIREAMICVLSTLPRNGGRIRLVASAHAESWIRATRLYLVVLDAMTTQDAGKELGPTITWL